MLNIDGKNLQIGGLNFDGFEKSDVAMAFSYGEKSIDFKKKGSEIKSLLYSKKVILEDKCRLNHAKCVALKKDICDMLGKDCDDEMEHMSIYGLQCSDECKACIMKFNQCLMECESIKRDCKTIDTLIKHLEDGKTYSLSLPQMQSIEKAETFYKGSAEQSLKIAEEVLKQYHDGELVINGKKASKEEAMKIAMERAGLKREEVEKCGETMEVGDVVQKADMDDSFDVLIKGAKDISKLTKKVITNKKGQRQTVYVSNEDKKKQAEARSHRSGEGEKIRYVDKFDSKDGIQVSEGKTDDGKVFYSGHVRYNNGELVKIIPMNEDKSAIEKRGKELYSKMVAHSKKEAEEKKKRQAIARSKRG